MLASKVWMLCLSMLWPAVEVMTTYLFCLWNVIVGLICLVFKKWFIMCFGKILIIMFKSRSLLVGSTLIHCIFVSGGCDITQFHCLLSVLVGLHHQHWLRTRSVVGLPFSQYFKSIQTGKRVAAIFPLLLCQLNSICSYSYFGLTIIQTWLFIYLFQPIVKKKLKGTRLSSFGTLK